MDADTLQDYSRLSKLSNGLIHRFVKRLISHDEEQIRTIAKLKTDVTHWRGVARGREDRITKLEAVIEISHAVERELRTKVVDAQKRIDEQAQTIKDLDGALDLRDEALDCCTKEVNEAKRMLGEALKYMPTPLHKRATEALKQ